MFRWFSRCLPGLTLLLYIVLLVSAFSDLDEWIPWLSCARGDLLHEPAGASLSRPHRLKLSQQIILWYNIILHIDTAIFPARLCLALIRVRNGIEKALLRTKEMPSANFSIMPSRSSTASPVSESGSEESHDTLETLVNPDEVIHAIILPNYAEDMETLTATLRVLASHERAATQYKIYLAMEEKESNAGFKAASLHSMFENQFLAIHSTFHPANLPGEVAGKGSNVAFAARKIFAHHQVDKNKYNCVITVIDSDTHLSATYFNEIRSLHHTDPNSSNAVYVCPIIFDRNAHDSPTLVRIADILWGCAGLAGFLPYAPILIPTSVYSIPLTLAEDVGGWDGDATAIGEDMHMLIKVYFKSRGTVATIPLYSPASQCNVSSALSRRSCYRTLDTLRARWRQALRHMWGALDIGFAVRSMKETRLLNLTNIPLFHLLWEAHFVPTHFVLMIFASGLYAWRTPSHLVHPDLAWMFGITSTLRTISFILMQFAYTLYTSYHTTCVTARAREMAAAGISDTFSYREPWRAKYVMDRIVFPVAGVLYGALPAFYAQIAHMWTEKLVYGVSMKPLLNSLA